MLLVSALAATTLSVFGGSQFMNHSTSIREIRADFDRSSIVVYQAYGAAIADAALGANRFVPPFSLTRMTWIKPSFLWLMHRSQWGQKRNQERTLKIRISLDGWKRALESAVLTAPDGPVFSDRERWAREFPDALVHVQWDTERSLRGAALNHTSIQVGLSRHVIADFVQNWTISIEDLSPLVAKIRKLLREGKYRNVKRLLPPERIWSAPSSIAARLWISTAP